MQCSKLKFNFVRSSSAHSLKLCTPLIYSNDNWMGKCAHIGRTRPKNVRLAAEMCAPGAECTVYFEHCYDNYIDELFKTGSKKPTHSILYVDQTVVFPLKTWLNVGYSKFLNPQLLNL